MKLFGVRIGSSGRRRRRGEVPRLRGAGAPAPGERRRNSGAFEARGDGPSLRPVADLDRPQGTGTPTPSANRAPEMIVEPLWQEERAGPERIDGSDPSGDLDGTIIAFAGSDDDLTQGNGVFRSGLPAELPRPERPLAAPRRREGHGREASRRPPRPLNRVAAGSSDGRGPKRRGFLSRPVRRGFLVALSTVVLSICWASTARLENTVLASGYVAVSSATRPVHAVEAGVLRRVLVRDGEFVRAGTPLVHIGATPDDTDPTRVRRRQDAARATIARLIAERDGLEVIVFPQDLADRQAVPEIAALLKEQIEAFQAWREAQGARITAHYQRIEALRNDISLKEAEVSAISGQIIRMDEDLTAMQDAPVQGTAVSTEVMVLERDLATIEAQRAGTWAEIAKARQEVSKIQIQINEESLEDRARVLSELDQWQKVLTQGDRPPGQRDGSLEDVVLTAPVSGTVTGMAVSGDGQSLPAGHLLLEIKPDIDAYVIEIALEPGEGAGLAQGQAAEIAFGADGKGVSGPVPGKVVYVADKKVGDLASLRAEIEIDLSNPALKGLRLTPGMPAKVRIKTDTSSVIAYLFNPLTKNFRQVWGRQPWFGEAHRLAQALPHS